MKTMNPHPLKMDVVKFNSKNNFDIWRCEVIDALTISNLKTLYGWRKSTILLLKRIATR